MSSVLLHEPSYPCPIKLVQHVFENAQRSPLSTQSLKQRRLQLVRARLTWQQLLRVTLTAQQHSRRVRWTRQCASLKGLPQPAMASKQPLQLRQVSLPVSPAR